MKINPNNLINYLNQKWKGKVCQMCGEGKWSVPDTVHELREYSGGGLVVGGVPIVPVIPITCDNCGNTVLVNALVTGSMPTEKGEPK